MARRNVQIVADIQSVSEAFDFRPARHCSSCGGSCRTFEDPVVIRRLLQGEAVQIFRGTETQIRQNARLGCELASLLEYMLHSSQSDERVFFSVKKVDEHGPQGLQLLSLLEGELGRQQRCGYLEVVTGPGTSDLYKGDCLC